MATNAGVATFPSYAAATPQTAVRSTCSYAPRCTARTVDPVRDAEPHLPGRDPHDHGAIFLLATILQPSMSYRRIPALRCVFAYLWMFGFMHAHQPQRARHARVPALSPDAAARADSLVGIQPAARPDGPPRVLITLAFAAAGRAALQVLGIGATAQEVWTGGERVTAFGQNANLSAIIMSVGAGNPVEPGPKIITWPVAAVVGLAIIQTGSRGGLICLVLGVLVWAIVRDAPRAPACGESPWGYSCSACWRSAC